MLETKKNVRHLYLALYSVLGVFILLGFQNCKQNEFEVVNTKNLSGVTAGSASSPSKSPAPGPTPQPAGEVIPLGCASLADCAAKETAANLLLAKLKPAPVADCLTNNSYATCLFLKNPVAAKGSLFSSVVNNSMDLSAYQTLGVNFDPASYNTSTGCLENSTYIIYGKTTTTNLANGSVQLSASKACFTNFKAAYKNDTSFNVAALMAHYYLNLQQSFMTEWVGSWSGTNKAIPVFSYANGTTVNGDAFDNNASFSGSPATGTGKIFMGAWERGLPAGTVQEMALNSEVYLHEAGHSNIFFGTNAIPNTTKNIACGTGGTSKCCNTADGCYGAINEGQADYHSLILFPDSPVVGEAIFNANTGLVEFGLSRNYDSLTSLTPATAYAKPGTQGQASYNGEIHILGRIWGSYWYESRKLAKAQIGARGVRAIDKVFGSHLLALTGDDDFKTACQKVGVLAGNIDGGAVQKILTDGCTQRGF